MTRTRLQPTLAVTLAAAALSATLLASGAQAQSRDNNFLDNLFSRGESGQQQAPQGRSAAPADDADITVRLDRMESALRQLTGTIEQLQYRNQQLEQQVQRLQQAGGAPAAPQPQYQQQPQAQPQYQQQPVRPNQPAATAPGRRSDVYDPTQDPNAPGAPRTLGNQTASAAPSTTIMSPEQPVGAPGGRDAGAPLDLSSLSANAAPAPAANQPANQQALQPPQTAPRVATPNTQLATLPPSAKPQDEYDLAYGYVLHKDYGLAEQAFTDFLRKYPNERLVPDANYWLGESQFQQQRYSDAAKSFLVVLTKHDKSGKAPDSLLRLGQSLAALNKKEAACATLAEVGRKYPTASATVKRNVAQEQKRVHC